MLMITWILTISLLAENFKLNFPAGEENEQPPVAPSDRQAPSYFDRMRNFSGTKLRYARRQRQFSNNGSATTLASGSEIRGTLHDLFWFPILFINY